MTVIIKYRDNIFILPFYIRVLLFVYYVVQHSIIKIICIIIYLFKKYMHIALNTNIFFLFLSELYLSRKKKLYFFI